MAQPKFRATAAVIVSALILAFGLFLIIPDRTSAPTTDNAVQSQATVVTYEGVEGKDALTLLKEKHTVETESSAFGEFVKSIDGVAAGTTHFWAFYVNDNLAEVGAGAYITKSGDQIRWQLDAIN